MLTKAGEAALIYSGTDIHLLLVTGRSKSSGEYLPGLSAIVRESHT